MKIIELKSKLKDSTKEELIKTIVDLYKKDQFVKDYYQSKFTDADDLSLLEKQKERITKEFFSVRGYGRAKLSVAKKVITEYKKLNNNPDHLAELMLFYVETGVEYTNHYGDIDEQFYISMENMYETLLKHIVKNNISDKYTERCQKTLKDSKNTGWGFHDQLCDLYYEYFGDKV